MTLSDEEIDVVWAAMAAMVIDVHSPQDNLSEAQWSVAERVYDKLNAHVDSRPTAPARSAGPLSWIGAVTKAGTPVTLETSGAWPTMLAPPEPPGAGLWHWNGSVENAPPDAIVEWQFIGEWTQLPLPALP